MSDNRKNSKKDEVPIWFKPTLSIERISSFSAVMLPRTVPSTTIVFARMFKQVTRPVSPTTIIPRICISPSNVPSMRTPPAPRKLPRQLIPGPSTEVTRSIAAEPVCPDEFWLSLLFCRLNTMHPSQTIFLYCGSVGSIFDFPESGGHTVPA